MARSKSASPSSPSTSSSSSSLSSTSSSSSSSSDSRSPTPPAKSSKHEQGRDTGRDRRQAEVVVKRQPSETRGRDKQREGERGRERDRDRERDTERERGQAREREREREKDREWERHGRGGGERDGRDGKRGGVVVKRELSEERARDKGKGGKERKAERYSSRGREREVDRDRRRSSSRGDVEYSNRRGSKAAQPAVAVKRERSQSPTRDREREARRQQGRNPENTRAGDWYAYEDRHHQLDREVGGSRKGLDRMVQGDLPLPPPPPVPLPPPPPRGRDEGSRGGGGRGGGRGAPKEEWGRPEDSMPEPQKAPQEAMQPNLGLSGKLAAETNKVGGIQLKYQEPPESCMPDKKWRLYTFKGDNLEGDPVYLHRNPFILFGRDKGVADLLCAHPSISKQHAVLQFRKTAKPDEFGLEQWGIRPYLMDLETVNGTFLNGERVEPLRFYELMAQDVIKFGQSTRDYVLLYEELAAHK